MFNRNDMIISSWDMSLNSAIEEVKDLTEHEYEVLELMRDNDVFAEEVEDLVLRYRDVE